MSIAPAPPVGRLERYLLIAGVLIQQAAFIPIPEALSGIEPEVDRLGQVVVDPGTSNPLNFSVTVGYLGIIAVMSIIRRSALVATIKQNPLVIATTALVVASVLWSFDPALSVRRAATYSIGVWLAMYLVARCDFPTIVRILATGTLLPAVCSILYFLVFPSLAQDAAVPGVRGVYAHKNQLAAIMVIGCLLQIHLGLATGHWRKHALLAVLHAALVVMARSSTATLSLVLVAALLVWLHVWRFNRHLGAMAGLAALLLLSLAVVWGVEDPDELFTVLGRDPTLTGRTDLWMALWPYIEQRIWLGWGFTAFWQATNDAALRVWSQVTWPPPHSHNGALEVLLDLGVVGLVLVLLMLVRFGLHTARAAANDPGPGSQLLWCLLALTLITNTVEITLLRGQSFPWFTFLVFYMAAPTIGRRAAPVGTAVVAAAVAPASVLARAKPLRRPAPTPGPVEGRPAQ